MSASVAPARTPHRASLPLRIALIVLLLLPAGELLQAQHRVVDITREQLSRLGEGMTSMDLSIYGLRLGMPWEEARSILTAAEIPFQFTESVPTTVYFGPSLSTFSLRLNPSSLEIIEMAIENDADLPRPNRYLANGMYWRLTTARMYFFGTEGHFVVNEDDTQFSYPRQGFALRCVDCEGFRFVLLPVPSRLAPKALPVRRQLPPIIDKFEIDVPFFVTGYWKPNSTENLADLVAGRRTGLFKAARFIDTRDANYDSLALLVDATLERGTHFIESTLLELRPSMDDVGAITIIVRGFADRKSPAKGRYVGAEVRVGGTRIPNGARIHGAQGNILLAKLRAAHTANELEARLSSSGIYQTFKNAGKIRISAEGHGVENGDAALLSHRRAEIAISVR